jgi:hypothetical protein
LTRCQTCLRPAAGNSNWCVDCKRVEAKLGYPSLKLVKGESVAELGVTGSGSFMVTEPVQLSPKSSKTDRGPRRNPHGKNSPSPAPGSQEPPRSDFFQEFVDDILG